MKVSIPLVYDSHNTHTQHSLNIRDDGVSSITLNISDTDRSVSVPINQLEAAIAAIKSINS